MTNAQEFSRKYLKKNGYHIDTVERWLSFPKKENGKMAFKDGRPVMVRMRQDCYGCFDLVAVHPSKTGTLYVQTTTTDHQAERIAKVLNTEATPVILAASNRIHVHGVRKAKKGKRTLMKLTVTEIFNDGGILGSRVIDDVDDDTDPKLFPAEQAEDDF